MKKNVAFWNLGFRPFFFLGALWSFILLLLWVGYQSNLMTFLPYYTPLLWHSHEMIFGFIAAILAGFLLTATQNWTGIRGVHGTQLKILVLLWILGRVLPFCFPTPSLFVSLVDLLFFPLLFIYLIPYLGQKKQRRNQFFFLLLTLLFFSNLLVHLEILGGLEGYAKKGMLCALDTTLLIVMIIAGRIIPFFTQNALPHVRIHDSALLKKLGIVSVVLFSISHIFGENGTLTAIFALLTALIHSFRFAGFGFLHTWKNAILCILHLAYLWIILGFFLKGLTLFVPLIPSLPTHALASGGIGIMIYGMITRVSLGHTARPMQADFTISLGYLLINAAAIARIFLPMFLPSHYLNAVILSGGLWIMAYLAFLIRYSPVLLQPRLDGKEG